MKQGWESKKLGEVAKIGAGNSAPQDKSLFTNGVYPFFRTSDIGKIRIGGVSTAVDLLNDQGIKKLKLYPKGTILLPKSGASTFLNHRVILDVNGFVSSHLATVVCDEDLLDKRFALYYLIGIKAQDLIQDHSYPSLKLSDIKEIPIPIPSLEEQKQIVAKLDQCFEAIDKAKANAAKNLENAKELFQSKLNDIFSQKGEGWVEKKLGDVCSLIKRGIPPKYIETGGIQVVNQKCIRNHKVNLTLARRHNIVLKSVSQEKLIQIGDVLVNSTGVGTLGRVAQVRDSIISDTTVDTHVTIVRPIPDLFFIDFFGYVLIKIEDEITKSGEGASGQTELARTKLQNNFIVSYPTSLEEQKQIVKILDSLKKQTQSLESKYQQELNSLEELKKSILQKAFEGEL